jgi:hypothetical protein
MSVTIEVVDNEDGTWTATDPVTQAPHIADSKWKAIKAVADARVEADGVAAAIHVHRQGQPDEGDDG